MGDICISLNDVKPGFVAAAKALDANDDGKACSSENPKLTRGQFWQFRSLVRKDKMVRVYGTKILRSQLNTLHRLAARNGFKARDLLIQRSSCSMATPSSRAVVAKGYVVELDLIPRKNLPTMRDFTPLRALSKLKRLSLGNQLDRKGGHPLDKQIQALIKRNPRLKISETPN